MCMRAARHSTLTLPWTDDKMFASAVQHRRHHHCVLNARIKRHKRQYFEFHFIADAVDELQPSGNNSPHHHPPTTCTT